MTYGPPAPPTAEKAYASLSRTVRVTIPRSLRRTQLGIRRIRAIRRRG
jgi:hypothetical protein